MGFFLFLVVMAGITAAAVGLSPARRIKRELRAAPTVKIAQLSDGELGRIVGRARVHEDELVAPLSGRSCVYYVARVEHEDGDDDWNTIIEEERGVAFVVEDDSGRAIVDAAGARMALDFDSRGRSGTFHDPDEAQSAFLAKHGQKGHGLLFNKKLRYREAVIELGETITVLGAGTREPDPGAAPGGYRDAQPTLLRLSSSTRYQLVISDDPSTTRA